MKNYIIAPANSGGEYNIQADRYEFDAENGRHLFYRTATEEGAEEELVANLINVSVRLA